MSSEIVDYSKYNDEDWIIEKISSLFKSFDAYELLIDINNTALIAGGSIAYAINDKIKASTVGDVDIFINDDKVFINILTMINIRFKDISYLTYPIPNPDNPDHSGGSQVKFSIVTIKFKNEKIPLQLIYKKFEDPVEVINGFDLDYVQCGVWKGKKLITDDCKKAHETMKIHKFNDTRFRNDRLLKAVKKGFTSPIITDSKIGGTPTEFMVLTDYQMVITGDICEFNDGYLNNDERDKSYNIDDLLVIGFEMEKQKKGRPNYYGFGKFVLTCEDLTIQKSVVSFDAEITGSNKYYVDIKHNKLSVIFDRIKNKTGKDVLPKGKTTLLIKGYMINDRFCAAVFDINKNAVGLKVREKFYISRGGIKRSDKIIVFNETDGKIDAIINYETSHKLMRENITIRTHNLKIMIEKTKDEREERLLFHKKAAYKCFLYYLEEKSDIEKGIQEACRQMTIDRNKGNDSSGALGTLGLILYATKIKSFNGMIKFIEGFH